MSGCMTMITGTVPFASVTKFEYAVMEESDKLANSNFAFDQWDTYQWYLDLGPLSNINDHYVHGKVPNWNDTVAHPDYDAYWKSPDLGRRTAPLVGSESQCRGLLGPGRPRGPWEIFRHAAENDPDNTNLMVAGRGVTAAGSGRPKTSSGRLPLGHETAREFREAILAPFFAYWLHGKGKKPDWRAKIFQTGSNTWRTYPEWPQEHGPDRAVPARRRHTEL